MNLTFLRFAFLLFILPAFSARAAGPDAESQKLLLQAKRQEIRVAPDSAYHTYSRAAALLKELPGATPAYMQARLGMAKALLDMKALTNMRQQLTLDRKFISKHFKPLSAETRQYYLLLGELHFQEKDLGRILPAWHKARKISEQLYGPESMEAADVYAQLSKHFLFGNRMDSSSFYAKKALRNLSKTPEPLRTERASAIYNVVGYQFKAMYQMNPQAGSMPFMFQGKQYPHLPGVYLAFLDSALQAETWQAGKDGGNSGKVYYNMALAYGDLYQMTHLSNLPLAKTYGRKALELAERSAAILSRKHDPEIGLVYTFMANFYNTDAFYNKARVMQNYQLALKHSLPGYNKKSLYQVPEIQNVQSVNNLVETFHQIANFFNVEYQTEEPSLKNLEAVYQYCLKQIELAQYADDRVRFFNEENNKDAYEVNYRTYGLAINAAHDLYHKTGNEKYKEEAFQIAEKFKSYNLLQSSLKARVDQYLKGQEKLGKDYRDLITRVSVFEEQKVIADRNLVLRNSQPFASAAANLSRSEKQLDDFIQVIKEKSPEFFQAKVRKNYTLNLAGAQQQVGQNAAAISYFLNADFDLNKQAFVFIIRNNKTEFRRLELPQNYEEKIDSLVAGITGSDMALFKRYGNHVHKLVMEKVVATLGPEVNKLVIMPDGYLWQIPFETLLTQQAVASDYRKLPYLFRKYHISYQHSATLGKLFKEAAENQAGKHTGSILAMAPYADRNLAGAIATGKINLMSGDLDAGTYAKLPYTISLMQELQHQMEGLFLIDQEASEESFKKNASRFSIIHLATHAETDFQDPFQSKFLLAKGTGEDGQLHMNELLNMDIKPSLAVLSACETGVGRLEANTEGMTSLSWCFNYLGCPSTLSTLWKVDDRQTSNLLKGFYGYLFSGKTKNESLQQAKLDFISNARTSDEANPFYWSGMVLIGDDGHLNLGPRPIWEQWQFWTGAGLIIAVGLGLFLLNTRRRKKDKIRKPETQVKVKG